MKNLIQEFKDFAMKGNIVELAIVFVVGAALAAVIGSLVDNVLLAIVAAIFGQPDFGGLRIDIGDSAIFYGAFINEVVVFVLIALALFLFVVKPYQAARPGRQKKRRMSPPDPEDLVPLREIRDALRR